MDSRAFFLFALLVGCAAQRLERPEVRIQRAAAEDLAVPLPEPDPAACSAATDVEPAPMPTIGNESEKNLSAWVHGLAAPELGGRAAGTPDARRAARLAAEYFESIGAKPPDSGGFCQSFEAEGIRDQNVIAHLPAEPRCPWLVVGAHYDALGIDENGRVRPGADDNATGVAVVLELARLVTQGTLKPRVGLVLALFGAEEEGFLGAEAYVARPSVPLDRIGLMINVDMAGRRPRGYQVVGYEAFGPSRQRTIDRVRSASKRVGFEAVSMRLGERSDSAAFAPHVPTVFFSTTVHADYHLPTDTPDRVDFAQLGRVFGLVVEIVQRFDCSA